MLKLLNVISPLFLKMDILKPLKRGIEVVPGFEKINSYVVHNNGLVTVNELNEHRFFNFAYRTIVTRCKKFIDKDCE